MNFVDINTKNKLRQCINNIFGEENSTKKDFIIQYFVFHLKNKEKNSWSLRSCLPEAYKHIIFHPNIVHSNTTNVKINFFYVYEQNKNYILKKSLDFRGKSNEKSVFVCDLFDEFVPKNFKGDCELIPDATGAFEIKITADEILSDSDSDDNFIRIKKY